MTKRLINNRYTEEPDRCQDMPFIVFSTTAIWNPGKKVDSPIQSVST